MYSMRFAQMARQLGLELLGSGEEEVHWLEAGHTWRPSLPPQAVFCALSPVPSEECPGLLEHLLHRRASGLIARCPPLEHPPLSVALLSWQDPLQVYQQARRLLLESQASSALSSALVLEELAGLLHEPRAFLERLGRWLGISLQLVSPWGERLAWVGEGRLSPREPGEGPGYVALEAGLGLLVGYGTSEDLEAARPGLELAARLLKARAVELQASLAEEEGLRGALLDDLLLGEAEPERALAFGFDLGRDSRLALLEGLPILGQHRRAETRRREQTVNLRRGLLAYCERKGLPGLSTLRGGRAVFLWQPSALEREAQELLGMKGVARIGLSAPIRELARVPQAYREALIALKAARPGEALSFEGLDPVAWVLLQQSPEDLRALVERFLPLPSRLLRTLEAYFEAEGQLTLAASQLHIHPNTLRHRLARIEELLGSSLRSPQFLAQAYLALRARSLLED